MSDTSDMRAVIIPKSDQINADDLLAGPLTITVSKVTIRPGTEQPVSIHFEGDGGKPWKPCKSMARVMVHCWGPDANNYIGRTMTLYCDPSVRWGGMEVGGIRISHMTDINGVQTMALTATKGSKKPFKVMPLKATPSSPPAASSGDEADESAESANNLVLFFEQSASLADHMALLETNKDLIEWLKRKAPKLWVSKIDPAIKASFARHQASTDPIANDPEIERM